MIFRYIGKLLVRTLMWPRPSLDNDSTSGCWRVWIDQGLNKVWVLASVDWSVLERGFGCWRVCIDQYLSEVWVLANVD